LVPEREKVKAVISYEDDVHAWVYLDQVDKVIRYEAYVIDYDEDGEPGTLKFVIEEGVLDNVHEVPLFRTLLQEYHERQADADAGGNGLSLLKAYTLTFDGRLIPTPPLLLFYASLTSRQLDEIHHYFATQEKRLKREKKQRWMRMLRALGFDVMNNL